MNGIVLGCSLFPLFCFNSDKDGEFPRRRRDREGGGGGVYGILQTLLSHMALCSNKFREVCVHLSYFELVMSH